MTIKRILKRTLSMLGICLLLSLFAAPRIGKMYVTKNSKELLGRKLEIDKLRINYLTGKAKIIGLVMYEENLGNVFTSFKKLQVNISYWPLIKNELVVDEFSLDGFYCRVEQNGALFNFSDLISSTDTLPEVEIADTIETEPLLLTVKFTQISNSTVQYYDKLLEHLIAIDDLNLIVPEFSFGRGQASLNLKFDIMDGGRLATDFNLNQTDSTYTLSVLLDSINLSVVEPYAKDALLISKLQGYYSNNITISGSMQHASQIVASGWGRVDGFHLFDSDSREVLGFNQFQVDFDTIDLFQQKMIINKVQLSQPYTLLEISDTSNNWMALMNAPLDTLDANEADTITAPADTASNNKLSFALLAFVLEDGVVDFSDLSVSPKFATRIQAINLNSSEVTSSGEKVEIDMSAVMNNSAELSSHLQLNPLNTDDLVVDFSVSKFPMKDIEPYLIHFFGYPVESGFLNFSTQNKLTTTSMQSDNKLHIRKFKLGDADKENALYKVPLNMALGILSDKNGVIQIDLPVRSEGDDTKLGNLGKLVLKTFTNLIVKAATSPANVLAQMYGVDPEKIKELPVGIFDDAPAEADMATLDVVAKIVSDKPQLQAKLMYSLPYRLFIDSLAVTMVKNEYRSTYPDAPIADSSLLGFLTQKVTAGDPASISELCVAYLGEGVLKAQYDSIMFKQTDFVNDYLLSYEGIPENSFSILVDSTASRKEDKKSGLFNINFVLKENQ